MEHSHQPEKSEKMATKDHSKMEHNSMKHSDNPSMGMEGHDHHAMMIADFKRRFYMVLILTIPIMLLSTMIQKFIGVDWEFIGSSYILFALSSMVFFYGGWPFFKGFINEVKTKNPGMMFLIGHNGSLYLQCCHCFWTEGYGLFLGADNTDWYNVIRTLD